MKRNTELKIVPIGRRVRKKPKKDISKEPEMQELKRMIESGELDPDRTLEHLKDTEED